MRTAPLSLSSVTFPVVEGPESRDFWAAAAQHRLVVPSCRSCETTFWYPRMHCPRCGSRRVESQVHDGVGQVHSFALHHRALSPHLAPLVPYAACLVDLEGGPRITTLVESVEADLVCGLPVEVAFGTAADGRKVPYFRGLADASGGVAE